MFRFINKNIAINSKVHKMGTVKKTVSLLHICTFLKYLFISNLEW